MIEVLDIAFENDICEVAGTASKKKKKLHEFKIKTSLSRYVYGKPF